MRRCIAILSLLVCALAACSSGGSKTTTASTTTTIAAVVPGAGAVASAAAVTGAECQKATDALSQGAAADPGATGGNAAARDASNSFKALANAQPPGQLRDALNTLGDTWADFATGLGGASNYQDAYSAIQVFTRQDYLQAVTTVSTYVANGCRL